MILRNHGLLTAGSSLGECFTLMYNFQRACEVQMRVLGSGVPFTQIPLDVQLKFAAQRETPTDEAERFAPGELEWPAMLRLVDEIAPSFRDWPSPHRATAT